MSDVGREHLAPPPKEDPETLVLRGSPRPVVRFRRGLIIGITGAVATVLVTLAWVALEPPSFRRAASDEQGGQALAKGAPEALADAPAGYGEVPRLGPPLPGDLGRPILDHQRSMAEEAGSSAPGVPPGETDSARAAAEAERQRRVAAEDAARSSGVMVQMSGRGGAGASGSASPEGAQKGEGGGTTAAPGSTDATLGGAAGSAFARSEAGDTNPYPLRPAPSPWTLSAGTIIPASLVTGLNSDLPGTIIAQVTENVRDSATGRTVLVPQGARLIGSYDSKLAFGQRRALLVWLRIVFPDGSSVRLDNAPATNLAGYAGVRDKVDFHTWRLLQGIALSTLLGVSTELTFGSGEGDLIRAIRESTQQNGARAGEQITQHNLDVQPTLRVRPGWALRAVIHKDLVLRPWSG